MDRQWPKLPCVTRSTVIPSTLYWWLMDRQWPKLPYMYLYRWFPAPCTSDWWTDSGPNYWWLMDRQWPKLPCVSWSTGDSQHCLLVTDGKSEPILSMGSKPFQLYSGIRLHKRWNGDCTEVCYSLTVWALTWKKPFLVPYNPCTHTH